MASNIDIKVITGIKLKYISGKVNKYGTNHMFQVLDETLLQELIELGKDLKMPIWEYNGEYYLQINAVKLKEVKVEHCFEKDHPYIVDLSFSKYGFQANGEQITGYSIFEINKNINLLYIYRMGLSGSAVKLVTAFYHIVKHHVVAHVVLKYVEKITIACLISVHTKTLSAIAVKNT